MYKLIVKPSAEQDGAKTAVWYNVKCDSLRNKLVWLSQTISNIEIWKGENCSFSCVHMI